VSLYLEDILIFLKDTGGTHRACAHSFTEYKRPWIFLETRKVRIFQRYNAIFRSHYFCGRYQSRSIKTIMYQGLANTINVLDIRSFLGLANYFRRYIHDFTKHAVPLINLTKGNNSRSQRALADAKTLKIRDLNVPLKLSPMHQTLHWVLS
jgi:hypothetical protein